MAELARHLAITLVVLALMLNICVRALDAAYVPDYHLGSTTWWVTPPQARGTNGLLDTAPRALVSYRVRLACVGEGSKTVLYESRSGVPGSVEASWAIAVANNQSARACTWDRPGYGLSDNAPSAGLEHTVQALEEALEASGELARTDEWILVGSGYGALVSRVFAARHPKLVGSMLFLDAQTESTYFQPKAYRPGRSFTYFFRDSAYPLRVQS